MLNQQLLREVNNALPLRWGWGPGVSAASPLGLDGWSQAMEFPGRSATPRSSENWIPHRSCRAESRKSFRDSDELRLCGMPALRIPHLPHP